MVAIITDAEGRQTVIDFRRDISLKDDGVWWHVACEDKVLAVFDKVETKSIVLIDEYHEGLLG